MILYPLPLNSGSERSFSGADFVPEVQDNKWQTMWAGTTLTLQIDIVGDGTGSARMFDSVFVRCKTSGGITVSGINASITVSDTIGDGYGNTVNVIDADGFHNLLYEHPSKASAATVTITFTSTAVVSQLWILNKIISIPNDSRFVQLQPNESDPGGEIKTSRTTGRRWYKPPMRDEYPKDDIQCVCRFRRGQSNLELKKFFRDHRRGFVCAVDYPARPTLIHQYISQPNKSLTPISPFKFAGDDYSFTLLEI